MKKNLKKLTAFALVAVVGLGYTVYPAHAQEETETVSPDLEPNTSYKAYVQYEKAPDIIAWQTVTTSKTDGSVVIVEPANLTGKYGQKLSEVALPDEWKWADGTMALAIGTQIYPAHFDTTDYESQYDFTNVIGYNQSGHYVERYLTVDTSKGDSSIEFIDGFSLDKTYDTKPVSINVDTDIVKTGSTGSVSFSYEEFNNGTWQRLEEAPTGAGIYRVTATVKEDSNYNSATSQSLEFTISKADTELKFTVSNLDKDYDGKTVNPSTYQSGSSHARVLSWYKLNSNGEWEKLYNAPVNAGSYKVVATVEGDDNYNGAEVYMTFEIRKAIPSYTLPEGLIIKLGEAVSSLELPTGFSWIDDTQTADKLGMQTFRAAFIPEDTDNYQTVEVDIAVEVVPVLTTINHVPVINAENKILTIGDTFDSKKDVTASDTEDGDITNRIEVISNNVDTTKAGNYEVTYKVIDSLGAGSTKTITVTVKENGNPQKPDKDNSETNDKTVRESNCQISVQTGDQTNFIRWSVLLVMSALGMLLTFLFKCRKQR